MKKKSNKQSALWKNLFLMMRFCNSFGVMQGTKLFTKFKMRKTHELRVPDIQYPVNLNSDPKMSDRQTFYQLFLDGEYDIELDNPKVIVDGGANIGLFSVLMKNRFADAKIICVEPDPENFERLNKNMKQYSFVSLENCGIWNKNTTLKVYDKYNNGKWGMVVEEDCQQGTIPSISIGTLMEKYGLNTIDVLKLDIETSEKYVFSSDYETWLPKVKMIIIELHDWIENGCSKVFFDAISNTFKEYKYLIKGENTIIINQHYQPESYSMI